jgi:hypothetical protein
LNGRGHPTRRRDAAELLARPGCPLCHRLDEAEHDFFAWFVTETNADEPMRTDLERSLGFCPTHTRLLLADDSAPQLLASFGPRLAGAALVRLDGTRRLAPCPACDSLATAERFGLGLISEALDHAELARRYEATGGLCASHLRSALVALPERQAAPLAGTWREAEATHGPRKGLDADASARARLRATLPREEDEHDGTVERLCRALALGCCPACLAAGRHEGRYLTWAASADGLDDHALHTEMDLCDRHLADLRLLNPSRAEQLHRLLATRRGAAFEDFARRVAVRGRRRLRRPIGSRALAEAREDVARPPRCLACLGLVVQKDRTVELLLEAMADRSVRTAYAGAQGLCVRHLRPLPPEAPELLRETAAARLRILRWELVEDFRKRGWEARHEPPGPEHGAWLRLPAMLDGRTFLGATPPGS